MFNIAIVGAGPYGLSLAAHLSILGVEYRIFGVPMRTWRESMPKGMRLKSEGFASSLYDPESALPLARYCTDRNIDYADTGLPVGLELFTDYGLAFQQRFAPDLEQRHVVSVRRQDGAFLVELDDGETGLFRKVVLATGIMPFAHQAEPFASLPGELASHSSARHDFSEFAGRTVAVVGGGASSADCAVALAEAGANVRIVTRRTGLRFHNPPRRRTIEDRLRKPVTTIGNGWKSVFLTRFPLVFRQMPEAFRHDVTQRYLGPAPCWFTRQRIEADVTVETETTVTKASSRNGRVQLEAWRGGQPSIIEADHVIAATGFKVELNRMTFLDPKLRAEIRTAANTPTLSPWFESNVPGLFFVGVTAANVFGPLVRFACGAQFASKRLATRLNQTGRQRSVAGYHRSVSREAVQSDTPTS